MVRGILVGGCVVLFSAMVTMVLRLEQQVHSPPIGAPSELLDGDRNDGSDDNRLPLVICVGDSLTHGHQSGAWVNTLRKRFHDRFKIVNAGWNGDTSWNLLQRLDEEVLRFRPSVVVVLGGTNDAMGMLEPKAMGEMYKQGKAAFRDGGWKKANPEYPTLDTFRTNMGQLLERLAQSRFVKDKAILTIPMLGEQPHSDPNQVVAQFNGAVRELAKEHSATVLDLNSGLWKVVPNFNKHRASKPKGWDIKSIPLDMLITLPLVYFFGWSWNQASEWVGFHILVDGVHLNDRGAQVVSDLVGEYLESL